MEQTVEPLQTAKPVDCTLKVYLVTISNKCIIRLSMSDFLVAKTSLDREN